MLVCTQCNGLFPPDMCPVRLRSVTAGAVLLQEDDVAVDRPVCFFYRKFNRHQLNYSVVEKETLALVYVVISTGSAALHVPAPAVWTLSEQIRRLLFLSDAGARCSNSAEFSTVD